MRRKVRGLFSLFILHSRVLTYTFIMVSGTCCFVIVSCEVKLTITAQWMLSIAAAMIIICMNLCQCRKGTAKTEKPGLTSISFSALSRSVSLCLCRLSLCLSLSLPSVSLSLSLSLPSLSLSLSLSSLSRQSLSRQSLSVSLSVLAASLSLPLSLSLSVGLSVSLLVSLCYISLPLFIHCNIFRLIDLYVAV